MMTVRLFDNISCSYTSILDVYCNTFFTTADTNNNRVTVMFETWIMIIFSRQETSPHFKISSTP